MPNPALLKAGLHLDADAIGAASQKDEIIELAIVEIPRDASPAVPANGES